MAFLNKKNKKTQAVDCFSLIQNRAGCMFKVGAERPPSKTCSFCETNDIFKL